MYRVARIDQAGFEPLGEHAAPAATDWAQMAAAREQLLAAVRGRVPPTTAALLAIPRAGSEPGIVDWYSELQGQPVPLAALPENERRQAQVRLDQRLEDLELALKAARDAGAELPGDPTQLLSYPGPEAVYVLNGQPVIAFWGHRAQGRQPVAPPMPPPEPPSAIPPAPAAVAAAVAAPRRRWRWLLPLLLLLALLAVLGWWWWSHREPSPAPQAPAPEQPQAREPVEPPPEEPEPPPPEPPAEAPSETPPPQSPPEAQKPAPPPKPDPYVELQKRLGSADCVAVGEVLKDPLLQGPDPRGERLRQIASQKQQACVRQELQRKIGAAKKDCAELERIARSEPLLQSPQGEYREIRSALEQDIAQCKKQRLAEAQKQCPGVRPPELAPDLVLVFDASGSMGWPVDMTDEQARRVGARPDAVQIVTGIAGAVLGVPIPRIGGNRPDFPVERQRVTAAKRAAHSLVERLPSDVDTGLVLLQSCPAADPAGFYSPGQRGALLSGIDHIEPVSGTPLADGIRKAADMVDGVDKPASIVVLSDGGESCNADPCLVAAQIARQKPLLKINVVDIQDNGASRCLAQATGGQVFPARNAAEVAQSLERAAQDTTGPANCR